MVAIIGWVITNTFLWTAVVAVIIGCLSRHTHFNRSENTLRHLFLWFLGIAFLLFGFMHLAFSNFTAANIGWQPSPFQFEVGLANLSVSALGFMAFFKANRYFWLGAIISASIFSIGAGLGHIYQALVFHNRAVSNSGTILYTDILVPIVMIILWLKTNKKEQHSGRGVDPTSPSLRPAVT